MVGNRSDTLFLKDAHIWNGENEDCGVFLRDEILMPPALDLHQAPKGERKKMTKPAKVEGRKINDIVTWSVEFYFIYFFFSSFLSIVFHPEKLEKGGWKRKLENPNHLTRILTTCHRILWKSSSLPLAIIWEFGCCNTIHSLFYLCAPASCWCDTLKR